MLLVERMLGDERVVDLGDERGLSVDQSAVQVWNEPALAYPLRDVVQQRLLLRIGMRDAQALDRAVPVEDVDGAEVGERRHGELGEVGERRVIVERRAEHPARVREKFRATLLGLGRGSASLLFDELARGDLSLVLLGDVLTRANDLDRRAGVIEDNAPFDIEHPYVAGRADDAMLDLEAFPSRDGRVDRLTHEIQVLR